MTCSSPLKYVNSAFLLQSLSFFFKTTNYKLSIKSVLVKHKSVSCSVLQSQNIPFLLCIITSLKRYIAYCDWNQ